RQIRRAAIWFRVQFLVVLVLTAIYLIGMLAVIFTARSKVDVGAIVLLAFAFAIHLGIVCLFYFAYKTTWACRRWAPLTMMILHGSLALLSIALGFAVDVPREDETT